MNIRIDYYGHQSPEELAAKEGSQVTFQYKYKGSFYFINAKRVGKFFYQWGGPMFMLKKNIPRLKEVLKY